MSYILVSGSSAVLQQRICWCLLVYEQRDVHVKHALERPEFLVASPPRSMLNIKKKQERGGSARLCDEVDPFRRRLSVPVTAKRCQCPGADTVKAVSAERFSYERDSFIPLAVCVRGIAAMIVSM